jgi:hypothetical protein
MQKAGGGGGMKTYRIEAVADPDPFAVEGRAKRVRAAEELSGSRCESISRRCKERKPALLVSVAHSRRGTRSGIAGRKRKEEEADPKRTSRSLLLFLRS